MDTASHSQGSRISARPRGRHSRPAAPASTTSAKRKCENAPRAAPNPREASRPPGTGLFGQLWPAMPAFDWKAAISLALPLYLVTLASQNLPGLVVLRAAGYAPPAGKLIFWGGMTSTILAPFGAHGINLAARDSELMMLVGPSGCGKTTLLSLVAGTLAPDAGEIEVFGEKLHQMKKRALTAFRARNIEFIFQHFLPGSLHFYIHLPNIYIKIKKSRQ